MKYSKEKKEKIKAVATAIAIVLLGIGANIGLTLGVANAVQGTEIASLRAENKELKENLKSAGERIAKLLPRGIGEGAK